MTSDRESPQIELYGMASPNVRKITIMLAELGQPYHFRHVDVFRGGQFTSEFQALNPNRKVPVLVAQGAVGEDPIVVFESAAILIYLAERFGALLPTEEPARSSAIQWLMIQACNIGPMLGQFNHFSFRAREGNDYAYERYRREAERLYYLLEERLQKQPYLGGAGYSIADIATYPWTSYLERHGIDLANFPKLEAWQQKIAKRSAVVEGMQAVVQAEVTDAVAFGAASSRDLDRFFGRVWKPEIVSSNNQVPEGK